MPSQRKGLLNHLMLDCLIERTGFIRQDKHTSTSGFCFGCIAGGRGQECDWGLKRVRRGNQLFISDVWERLKYLFVQRIKGIKSVCGHLFLHSPGRRSRTAGRWLVPPWDRWRGRWKSSPSAGARHHWKHPQTLIKCFLFVTLLDRNLHMSSLFGRRKWGQVNEDVPSCFSPVRTRNHSKATSGNFQKSWPCY